MGTPKCFRSASPLMYIVYTTVNILCFRETKPNNCVLCSLHCIVIVVVNIGWGLLIANESYVNPALVFPPQRSTLLFFFRHIIFSTNYLTCFERCGWASRVFLFFIFFNPAMVWPDKEQTCGKKQQQQQDTAYGEMKQIYPPLLPDRKDPTACHIP